MLILFSHNFLHMCSWRFAYFKSGELEFKVTVVMPASVAQISISNSSKSFPSIVTLEGTNFTFLWGFCTKLIVTGSSNSDEFSTLNVTVLFWPSMRLKSSVTEVISTLGSSSIRKCVAFLLWAHIKIFCFVLTFADTPTDEKSEEQNESYWK